MPSLLDLSSEELISKGIAPIKKNHLLPFISKSAAPAKGEAAKPTAATAAQDTMSESKVVAKKSKRQTRKVYVYLEYLPGASSIDPKHWPCCAHTGYLGPSVFVCSRPASVKLQGLDATAGCTTHRWLIIVA